jgi:hypothetical protein
MTTIFSDGFSNGFLQAGTNAHIKSDACKKIKQYYCQTQRSCSNLTYLHKAYVPAITVCRYYKNVYKIKS